MAIVKEQIIPEQDKNLNLDLLEPPTDLIFDDGEPMESNRHRIGMNVLINSINNFFATRNDYFVGGNMFIYFSRKQIKNRDFRGPDFFVVLNVEDNPDRQGWVVWDENGRYPDVIIELMSPSTANIDKTTKKDIYEQIFHTPDYFVFDPYDSNSLQGWHLDVDRGYTLLEPNDKGWLWCQRLGLWVGVWTGVINNINTQWLRFYDSDENLVLLPSEYAQQQAQDAEQKAQDAEQKAQDAEQKAQDAEQKAQDAEQKAQDAEQKAQDAEQKAARLAARLRELGENPEEF